MSTTLFASNISKIYPGPVPFQALQGISLEIHKGEFVSITGKSGCGKSTLLYILSTLDTEFQGELSLQEFTIHGKTQNELARFRNQNLGFVFQFHYLLPDFSCLQNVMLPALRLGIKSHAEIEADAYAKLRLLGVGEQALKSASRISGGQQQRVAIARALVNEPAILMGDEPTGNLDSRNTNVVFDLFRGLAEEFGKTIITVTHDADFARRSDRIVEIVDGRVHSQ